MKNLFPEGKYSALLFDCDGTIADSMSVHLVAWNQALKPWGAELTLKQHLEWAGRPTKRITEMLNEQHRLNMPAEQISEHKEQAYLDLIHTVQPILAVKSTIEHYRGRLPMAVVSGSPRESVIKTLTHLHLLQDFQVIVGAEDYVKGKPAPDCFLKAAGALSVPPEKCLVFEDADLGVQAAQSAGMAWIRVSSEGFDFSRSRI